MTDFTQISEALQSSETFTSLINAILITKYGEIVYSWDPLTIYLELKQDYRVDPSSEVMDRVGALQAIMTTDAFFSRIDGFIPICNTLNNGVPHFQNFDPASVNEITWSITEVAMLRELVPFSYPIKQYINLSLKLEGYGDTAYPDILQAVLKKNPTSKEIKELNAGDINRELAEVYVDEQMKELIYQFNKIPSLPIHKFIFDEDANGTK